MPTKNQPWISDNAASENPYDFLIEVEDAILHYKMRGLNLQFEFNESSRQLRSHFRTPTVDVDQLFVSEIEAMERVLSGYHVNKILNSSYLAECSEVFMLLLDSGIKIDAVDPAINENIFHFIFENELETRYFVEEKWEAITNLLSILRAKVGDQRFFDALQIGNAQGKTPLELCKSNGYGDVSGSVSYLESFFSEFTQE